MKADFHIHTYYSDGIFSPEKLVDLAIEHGLECISLTDHDNVLSYDVAKKYIEEKGEKLELIRGVEINTLYKSMEVHILGYFMDINDKDFQGMLKTQQQARIKQTKEILALLKKKEGIKINFEDVKNMVAEGGSIGRPHIAKAITNAGGTSNVIEAYNKYIHINSPVYVERKTMSPFDVVEIIYDAGGIPVIAHPYDVPVADELIPQLVNCGLRGIEAYHRKHSAPYIEHFSTLAEEYGLIVTGGSDFHAPNIMNGQIILGKNFVPEWIYDKLVKSLKTEYGEDLPLNDICASFQECVSETLIKKVKHALEVKGYKQVVIAGGVAANSEIRRKIFELEKEGYRVNAPIMKYCTDNASMVASSAYFFDNTFDDIDTEVFSRVKR